MPIDLAAVNWLYVIVLAILVFVSTLVGNVLSFHHRMMAALLSAIVFAGLFVFWTYYPHNLPLPTTLTVQKAAAPPPAAPPPVVTPEKPRNPVMEIPTPAR
ncbi:MAG TPA: hypothetical protein VGF02_12260 [Pseudolabrys sp.]|jgi:hypothetical protein